MKKIMLWLMVLWPLPITSECSDKADVDLASCRKECKELRKELRDNSKVIADLTKKIVDLFDKVQRLQGY